MTLTSARALLAAPLSVLVLALPLPASAAAQPLTGLTPDNHIFSFDSAHPSTPVNPIQVSGLGTDTLIAIDRNPDTGVLYGLGQQSRMYSIDDGYAATQVGQQFTTLLTSPNADIDFDPDEVLAARITTDTDQNLVWTGSADVSVKSPIAWAAGDANSGNPNATGIAYDHNVPYTGGAKLFAYDYAKDTLATLPTPDNGQMTTVGSSGVGAMDNVLGLDSAPDGTTFALLRVNPITPQTRLFTLASNGTATSLGPIGSGGNTTIDIAADAVKNDFRFSSSSYSVGESAGTVTVTVTRSQTRGAANVIVRPSDGSAVGGLDYRKLNNSVQFADGEASKTASFGIRSDYAIEGNETFSLALSDPLGGEAALVAPSSAVVQIEDDDSGPPPSTRLTALTKSNQLVTFDSATPGTVSAPMAITGLPASEDLAAIDRRPATGQLFAMSAQSRLYTLDETSGAATMVGTGAFSPALTGNAWGFDFDPVADRIRVTGSLTGQHLTISPVDGTATAETKLSYAPGDPAGNNVPNLHGLGYSNNVPGATTTTLFAYDFTRDVVARVGSPGGSPDAASTGITSTIGNSGVPSFAAQNIGLDIAPDGLAWALIGESGGTRLNVLDLSTGIAGLVGNIGDGSDIYIDIAAPPVSNVMKLSAGAFTGSEASGAAAVTVTRSQSLGAATVGYSTSDGSALAGSDYTATSGTLAFAPGEASKTVSIPVAADTAPEGDETFGFSVSNAAGGAASIGSPATATVTIADSDKSKPVVSTCHKSKQKLVKQKAVIVCLKSNEAGRASATGKLKVRGVKRAVSLKKVSGVVTKGVKRKLKLKLSAKARRLMVKHRVATVKLSIRVRDAAGNERRLTRTVKAAK